MTELVFEFLKDQKKYVLRSKDHSLVNLPSDTELRNLYFEVAIPKNRCGKLDTIERFSDGCKFKFLGAVPGWLQTNFRDRVQQVLDHGQ
jgi:hypothetical protein